MCKLLLKFADSLSLFYVSTLAPGEAKHRAANSATIQTSRFSPTDRPTVNSAGANFTEFCEIGRGERYISVCTTVCNSHDGREITGSFSPPESKSNCSSSQRFMLIRWMNQLSNAFRIEMKWMNKYVLSWLGCSSSYCTILFYIYYVQNS